MCIPHTAKPAPDGAGNRLRNTVHAGRLNTPKDNADMPPVQPSWAPIGSLVAVDGRGVMIGCFPSARELRVALTGRPTA
jgi:hypothetical protein